MYIIGITGSFGSGKTTVARLLRRKGARVLDADKIAHRSLLPGGSCFKRVIDCFGERILRQGRIDRRALAKIVFDRPKDLKKLCGIIHPEVIKEIKATLGEHRLRSDKGFLVIDVPLLFEAGLYKICDCVVVVRASRKAQIKRIQKKSHLTKSEILKRIKAQMSIQKKISKADVVIDNQGNINQTKKQVEALWQDLKKMAK